MASQESILNEVLSTVVERLRALEKRSAASAISLDAIVGAFCEMRPDFDEKYRDHLKRVRDRVALRPPDDLDGIYADIIQKLKDARNG
jgi:uncharacterized protein (DUF2267 family)